MAPIDLTVPLLTADRPGVGGRIRVSPDDFEVDEVPAYEPCGTGDHLYLWVEKRDVGPEHLARVLADRAGVPVGTVGTAGLKDRHAVTRQWVSLPKEAEPRLGHLDGDGIRVLRHSRHGNKLKPGHLRGNRFRILVRDADRTRADDLAAILDRVREHGLPNYYGPQRFGRDGSTVDLGLNILAGKQRRRVRPFQFKFALSAVQSVAFNRWLALRLADGLVRTVLPGDVLMKWPAGGIFVSDDPATDQPRFDAREVVQGGPMFGGRMYAARGVAAEREQAALAACGLPAAAFGGFGKLMSGTRRHALVYPDDLVHEWTADGLRLTFTLPAGSYATVLLAEVMKADAAAGDEPDDE
jgi:tRNA pseudouridine13 synthase